MTLGRDKFVLLIRRPFPGSLHLPSSGAQISNYGLIKTFLLISRAFAHKGEERKPPNEVLLNTQQFPNSLVAVVGCQEQIKKNFEQFWKRF